MGKQRIEFLDFAKGIGIFLVVFGHCLSSQVPFIYAFHMPVFFFISGYVFTKKNIGDIIIDKFNRLYIPFIFFFTVSWLFYLTPLLIKGNSADIQEHLLNIKNILIGEEENGGNVPIWFLVCNFTLCVLYAVLLKYVKSIEFQSLICLALGITGAYMYKHSIVLPWKLDPAFSSILFFHAGYLAAKKHWIAKANNFSTPLLVAMIAGSIVISAYFSNLNIVLSGISKVNLIHNTMGEYVPFIVTAFLCIFWYMMISFKAGNLSDIVTYYGRNSLVILGTHYSILHIIKNLLKGHIEVTGVLFNIVLSIFLMLISIPLIRLSKRFVPKLTGYEKLIKPRLNAGVQA